MKILTRYIFKEAALYFLLCLMVFMGILITVRILQLTNLIVNKGVAAQDVGLVFISIIPTFLEIALPMATLLGIMLAFARLSGDSEIVVLRASGISLTQLIKPVVIFGLLITACSFWVSVQLRPWGYRTLSQTLFEIARTKSTAGLESGLFNKLGLLTLYAGSIDYQSGMLGEVLIDDKRNPERRQVITAPVGRILSDRQAQTISIQLKDGSIHENFEGKYHLTEFQTNSITLHSDEIFNPEAQRRDRRILELDRTELDQEINRHKDIINKQIDGPDTELIRQESIGAIAKLKLEKGRRLSLPIAALLLALIAMPLGIQPPRAQKSWGASLSIVLGLGVFVVYFALLTIGIALAESGILPPLLSLWTPNIVIGSAALYALNRMGTERWQSIAHASEQLIKALTPNWLLREKQ